jgi:dephospho-CoA kinase
MDKMVGVFAPADLRIARAVARGGVTAERVSEIMARQMDETEKMNRCDYVINNNDCQAVLPQVLKIHRELLDLSGVA